MISERNTALFVDEACSFIVRKDLAVPDPGENEILVRTVYSGANPADLVHSLELGIRSTVLGYDFSGEVVFAAPSSKFKAGQLVAGYTPTSLGRPIKYGAHQDFLVCPEDMCFPVPEHIPMSHAAGLTTVTMTAADALFNLFKLPLPGQGHPEAEYNNPGPLLIWGASTSVGICALQFAKAIGCHPILVTASSSRHSELLELGASKCFDYASPTVISEIKAAIHELAGGKLSFALDAAGRDRDPTKPSHLEQCVEDPETEIACVILRSGTKMPLAVRHIDVTFHLKGMLDPLVIPASGEAHWRAWEALRWAVKNYSKTFRLPWINEYHVNAEKALEELNSIATLGKGAGKTIFSHPFSDI
ncbi:hypothetical protein E8E13_001494 [Curvularia kusanoi]|uniref:Enoyl reductase (ER) domain-containing protein n=1 Tax=Curvularia kusanoi TaxID=90978 RepID=A0A9P4T3W0_CURKU|nr:hypothetical protein E8E13_001494 [Curvularia kusanoi]